MSAPQKVLELVDLFRRNADAYHAPQYNEAMVRQEFINQLFKCLGWDMDNEQGYAEAYKDVIHEAAIFHLARRLMFAHRYPAIEEHFCTAGGQETDYRVNLFKRGFAGPNCKLPRHQSR